MPRVTVLITGDKKLNRKLRRLTTKQQKKAFRAAARPAIKPIMQQARSNANVKSGTLKKSIKVRSQKRSRSSIGVRVTSRAEDMKGEQFYGAFQEFGWKAGTLRRQVEGNRHMERAAETKKASVMRDYRQRLKREIEKAAKS